MKIRSTTDRVEVLAPAKLNLFLEVTGKRPDGYHEIESLVVWLDLNDRLTFELEEDGLLSLACDVPSLSCDASNLVVRAAERLRHEIGGTAGARMTLEKRIPMQAGLGGGSSDAAAALAGLNRLWNAGLPSARLAELGADLGSDVPFFFHGPAAICRGRGEKVAPVPPPGSTLHFVLVSPDHGVSTADVYRALPLPNTPRTLDACVAAYCSGDTTRLGETLFNRLQPVSESLVPDLTKLRDTLTSLDPPLDGSLMSGSGSTYFGLCRNRDAAHAAARSLEPLGVGSIRVVTCGP